MEAIKDKERILKEIQKYKKIAVIGLAKNVGKTTVVNYLASNLSNVCILTIGRDGEERDALYGTQKPSVNLKRGNFAVIPYEFARGNLEIIETFDLVAGKFALVMATIDAQIQIARIGGFDLTNDIADYLLEFCDRIIIDGAFGRTGIAPYMDANIIVCGAASGDLKSNIKKIKKLMAKRVDPEIEERILPYKDSIVLIGENNRILDPNLVEEAVKESHDADFVYIPRVIDDFTFSRIKSLLVVPSSDFVLGNGEFFVLKEINIAGIAVNSVSSRDENPLELIDGLKSVFNDIIVFDVLYDP
ncbi:MAG: hypothetical protein C0176_00310 [Mesoaciditoga sp.]|uniref:hypothetical protein n=1 Tax=Athalassotoga sp. TaxID=2022597 RepID=UPI000CBD3422|nr:MAG: hypothetical protein C0185_01450 [Mesoaciditoga sp.]PMP80795.1 MAG: hypothetical protein C0176_00310 [Mesoaciditoga sp.]HEU23893.1 hypothetical protein [Mesoaciditoga lauensis]